MPYTGRRIGAELAAILRNYVRPCRLGRVTGADGVYKFPHAETGFIPDAGFYTAERWALILDDDKPIPFAPDLAATAPRRIRPTSA